MQGRGDRLPPLIASIIKAFEAKLGPCHVWYDNIRMEWVAVTKDGSYVRSRDGEIVPQGSKSIDTHNLEKILIRHGGKTIAWNNLRRCWEIDDGRLLIHPHTFEVIVAEGSKAVAGQEAPGEGGEGV